MLTNSSTDAFHPNLFGNDLLQQLDPADPLLQLDAVIPWQDFEQAFNQHCSPGLGAPGKPIRLMVGLLLLKQLEDLSDEHLVIQWKRKSVLPIVLRHNGVSSPGTLPQYRTG